MSSKKKRMREAIVEKLDGRDTAELRSQNGHDLLALKQLCQRKQKSEQKTQDDILEKCDFPEKHGKISGKVQPVEVLVDSDVKPTKSQPWSESKKKKHKSVKKASEELCQMSLDAFSSGSQKHVDKRTVSTDSAGPETSYHMQTRLKTGCTPRTVLLIKKKRRRSSKLRKDLINTEIDLTSEPNISNGCADKQAKVSNIHNHLVGGQPPATSRIIDLTCDESPTRDVVVVDDTSDDSLSLEPYSTHEISRATESMGWETKHGPLHWFLNRLKIRNRGTDFVPRTSRMEQEYSTLLDNFPMPTDQS